VFAICNRIVQITEDFDLSECTGYAEEHGYKSFVDRRFRAGIDECAEKA
jgi:hypothetical protein